MQRLYSFRCFSNITNCFNCFLAILICVLRSLRKNDHISSSYIPSNVRTPSYEELLQTENWHKKRQHILHRDGYRCCWCGSDKNLNVHHKYYSKHPNGNKVLPWNYPDDALITLCQHCHQKAHQRPIKTYYRRYTDNY